MVSLKVTKTSSKLAIRFIMPLFVLLVVMLCIFGVCSWRSHRHFMGAEKQEHRVVELIGVIKHLDEVLTMSAQMATVTGDPQWEHRYKTFEPQLDAAITEAAALFPESLSKFSQNLLSLADLRE